MAFAVLRQRKTEVSFSQRLESAAQILRTFVTIESAMTAK
jgi:hypothetical protein